MNELKKCVVMFLLVMLTLTGCVSSGIGLTGIEGSGNVVAVEYELDDFDKIEVHHAFDLVVSQGDEVSAVIDIDDNLVDYLDVYVKADTLHIGMKSRTGGYRNATFKAYVTSVQLDSFEGSGATSTVFEKDLNFGDRMSIDLSGASDLKGHVEAEHIILEMNGASEYDGSFHGRVLDLSLSGASDAGFDGEADTCDLNISGASSLNASGYAVESARIELSGASDAKLAVSETLSIEASGASDALIYGHPRIEKQEISGGAEVEFE